MAKLGITTVGQSVLDGLAKPRSSKEVANKNFRIVLIGQPGEGKTICALSASNQFPDEPGQKWASLDDTRVVLYDNGGLDSAQGLKLEVQCYDLTNINSGGIVAANSAVFRAVKAEVEAGIVKTVVIDSLSMLDIMIKTPLQQQYEKWGLYDAILKAHSEFFSEWKSLPANLVFVTHGKVASKPQDDDSGVQVAKLAAEGIAPGETKIDVSGAARDYYRRVCSAVFPIGKVGPVGKEEFWIYPHGGRGCEHKCRYRGLAAKEPANLRKLFEKIRKENEEI